MQQLWNVEECAQFLGVSISMVYKLVHEERIPHVKFGRSLRFVPTSIERWVQQRERRTRKATDWRWTA